LFKIKKYSETDCLLRKQERIY